MRYAFAAIILVFCSAAFAVDPPAGWPSQFEVRLPGGSVTVAPWNSGTGVYQGGNNGINEQRFTFIPSVDDVFDWEVLGQLGGFSMFGYGYVDPGTHQAEFFNPSTSVDFFDEGNPFFGDPGDFAAWQSAGQNLYGGGGSGWSGTPPLSPPAEPWAFGFTSTVGFDLDDEASLIHAAMEYLSSPLMFLVGLVLFVAVLVAVVRRLARSPGAVAGGGLSRRDKRAQAHREWRKEWGKRGTQGRSTTRSLRMTGN